MTPKLEICARLRDMAERCEQATGPDRVIDALIDWPEVFEPARISQDVGGQMSIYWNDDKFCRSGRVPRYTASLDAAMSLVPEGWTDLSIRESVRGDTIFTRAVITLRPLQDFVSDAATPALALTAAALRALATARQAGSEPPLSPYPETASGDE